jgi:hypothetical protein
MLILCMHLSRMLFAYVFPVGELLVLNFNIVIAIVAIVFMRHA